MEVSYTQILLNILPALIVVITILITYILYLNKKIKKEENYKTDKFRQEIEVRIAELTNQMMISHERFDKMNYLLKDAQEAILSDKNKMQIDFFKQLGITEKISIDPKLVFILTPFNPNYKSQYEAIKDTAESLGFIASKGDDDLRSRSILRHIIKQIMKSRIVIANISSRNPNVFYELGIAHAIGKPVLMISETLIDLPFDINSTRIMTYQNEEELKNRLRNWMVHTLSEIPADNT